MDTVDIIFNLLKQKGIQQKDFAEAIGVTKHKVSEWKARKTKSYDKHYNEIASYLGVSIDYLLGNEQKNRPSSEEESLSSEAIKLSKKIDRLSSAKRNYLF